MSLWSGAELQRILDATRSGRTPDVTGIAIDSRTLRPGDLFMALDGRPDPRYRGAAGSGRDGHDFVADAARRGAAAAVVSRPTGVDIPELKVNDVFSALWALARAARARYRGPVLALTGSSGKTTAKGMLQQAIAGSHASEGSFNNHLGVPLSLSRLPVDASAAIFELGMNSPGEIQPLAELVRPDVALVLNVLPVHLEGLGTLAAIRREKLSIAAGLEPDGTLVVPAELASQGDLPETPRRLTFGRDAADVQLMDQRAEPAIRLPDGTELPLQLATDGPHLRLTGCAVAACMHAAGCDVRAGLARLARLHPPAGRGGRVEAGGVTLIDDSYNANPESVRLALAAVREYPAGRRFALLGDMLELGPEAPGMHAALAEACEGLDKVFCVGELMESLHAVLPEPQRGGWWPDCGALDCGLLAAQLRPGDLLLVKGSNKLFWQHGTVRELAVNLGMRMLAED